jgi:hypothetical protein
LAGESYRRDETEQLLKPDEIMQMFGRAGRRGLDEMGYVIISANELRLLDAHASHLSRSAAVDWGALLGLMTAAAERGRNPFAEAVCVQDRLFTTKPILLGVEESMRHPDVPCRLHTDAERARHVRKRVREMLNSLGQWEPMPAWTPRLVADVLTPEPDHHESDHGSAAAPRLVPVVSVPAAIERIGSGSLCEVSEPGATKVYGRALTVADHLNGERVVIAKWVRRLTNWSGRQAPLPVWRAQIAPLLASKLEQQKTPLVKFVDQDQRIVALVSIGQLQMRVPVDSHGVALWRPVEREVLPYDCARCSLIETCKHLSTATGTALLWRRLGLVDAAGVPTRRGEIVSFFSQGDGLAFAAALEDETYPLDELIYDLADLDGGFRFCGEDNRWGGRLAIVCHEKYGLQSIPGYLENGVPPKYGAGAERVVASVHKNPATKHAWVTDLLGPGDIDRVIIEWRSLLRQIAHAPPIDWPRWTSLQALAKATLNETESPTLTELPPLAYDQTRRVDHRLIFRRH